MNKTAGEWRAWLKEFGHRPRMSDVLAMLADFEQIEEAYADVAQLLAECGTKAAILEGEWSGLAQQAETIEQSFCTMDCFKAYRGRRELPYLWACNGLDVINKVEMLILLIRAQLTGWRVWRVTLTKHEQGEKMNKPIAYLFGPIEGLTYGASTSWREYVESRLDRYFEVLSPMRGKEFFDNGAKVYASDSQHLICKPAVITTRDLLDVRRADVLIGNLGACCQECGGVGWGSPVEVGIAVERKTPIVAVIPPTMRLRQHPFIEGPLPGLIVVSEIREALALIWNMFNLPEEEPAPVAARVGNGHATASMMGS